MQLQNQLNANSLSKNKNNVSFQEMKSTLTTKVSNLEKERISLLSNQLKAIIWDTTILDKEYPPDQLHL